MKTAYYWALAALLLPELLWAQSAQTNPPAQPERAVRKIYQSPMGEVYMHPQQPLYLWVSGSEGSEKFPLQTKADWVARVKGQAQGNSPFRFRDGEGRHTLVHPNGEGHFWSQRKKLESLGDEEIFYFHLDGQAPRSWPASSGAPKGSGPLGRYYGGPVKISLKAQDQGAPPKSNFSGLQSIYYSLDGAAFEVYRSPLSFEQERAYQLRYYAVDQVGNQEKLKEFKFHLDLSPPQSSIHYHGPKSGEFLSAESSLSFKGQDSGVGLAAIHYEFRGPQKLSGKYGSPISLKKLKEGRYEVSYEAVDKVRNRQTPAQASFVLDQSAPRLRLNAEGDGYRKSGMLYVSQRSKLALQAQDAGAGVDWVKYKFGKSTQTYQSPFEVPKASGEYLYKAWARDKVGNQTRLMSFKVVQDPHPPTSRYQFKGNHYIDTKGRFLSPKGQIILSASDKASGVATKFYGVDGAAPAAYRQPIGGFSGGQHELVFYATDQVANQERQQRLTFFVDDQPPEVATRFSTGSMGESTYPQGSLLFLMGTDKASGLAKIRYRLNGGQEVVYDQPLRLDRPGRYDLEVWASDRVGNQAKIRTAYQVR
ncbi:MAG: chitobiase/beta-hexosaminidase C-terminal domain-containing protein [bacterium]|nr:chitobiase/beta-hexosaminidase C-terminal domain-containing protein [bacterium]